MTVKIYGLAQLSVNVMSISPNVLDALRTFYGYLNCSAFALHQYQLSDLDPLNCFQIKLRLFLLFSQILFFKVLKISRVSTSLAV